MPGTVARQRLRRLARLAIVPVAIAGSAVAISSASYSAFSATTSNATNNWATGNVNLSDDDSGSVMFNATALRPGSAGSKCIKVTSNGSLPSSVKLYGTGYDSAASSALASQVTLSVSMGTGGSFSDCTGFSGTSIYSGTLDAFGTGKTGYATGIGTWTPTGGTTEAKVYQFAYTVGASAPAGSSASIGFTWEAQNT